MARAKTGKKETRRGSPEAIAKRRAARALNSIFDKGPAADSGLDGRTLKRKRRLLKELKEGKGGEPIKAHQVLSHATELFGMGETLTTLRKMKPLVPPTPTLDPETVGAILDTQASYGFHPAAWKLLGVDIESLSSGAATEGSAEAESGKPKRKARAKKK